MGLGSAPLLIRRHSVAREMRSLWHTSDVVSRSWLGGFGLVSVTASACDQSHQADVTAARRAARDMSAPL